MLPYIGPEFVEALRLQASSRQVRDRSSGVSLSRHNAPHLTLRQIRVYSYSLLLAIAKSARYLFIALF